jgi:hypothetical protein
MRAVRFAVRVQVRGWVETADGRVFGRNGGFADCDGTNRSIRVNA